MDAFVTVVPRQCLHFSSTLSVFAYQFPAECLLHGAILHVCERKGGVRTK